MGVTLYHSQLSITLGQWYEADGRKREAAALYGEAKAEVDRMVAAMPDESLRATLLQSATIQAIDECLAGVR